MISWRDFDRAMPRRPDQPGDTDEPAGYPIRCSWCLSAPEPGESLCRVCAADLATEQRLWGNP